jgi:hypothetical protein
MAARTIDWFGSGNRSWRQKHHPDIGGEPKVFIRMMAAHDAIKKALGW